MTGPFYKLPSSDPTKSATTPGLKPKKSQAQEDVPDRPRSVVMGIILHQVDQSSLATAVVVDRFGEVQGHWNFNKLLQPRGMAKPREGAPKLSEEEEMRRKKMMLNNKEEEAEYQRDKEKIIAIIKEFDVDLVVVGANSLNARRLKQTLDEISSSIKDHDIKDNKNDKDD